MCSGKDPANGRITIPMNTLEIGLSSVSSFRASTKKLDVGPKPATDTRRAMKQTLRGKNSSFSSDSDSVSESESESDESVAWLSESSLSCLSLSLILFIALNSSLVDTISEITDIMLSSNVIQVRKNRWLAIPFTAVLAIRALSRPPKKKHEPITRRLLDITDPTSEVMVKVASSLETVVPEMISSTRLPNVAFKRAPRAGPTWCSACSVTLDKILAKYINAKTKVITAPISFLRA
ncbi:hypothetical protein OGAPHI_004975 [Ogataea philodendri]|uniref:Uncharacterized protein n=1 Tax=Ogataea philodendri TaxID=1378263 RepID=A0A9P8T2V4_9ASCO|nr:uncharacterized protein OGAPHI_004975 [Ogataea philodendri]KAH3663574.1 hypothetical protein OGAPHI_004975 [Ogataea philodendri]